MSHERHPEETPGYEPRPVDNRLRDEPSAELWEEELGAVLYGERDHILLKLGRVAAYTEAIIMSSRGERAARAAMLAALRRVVGEWRPETSESDYQTACLLDLIGAYLPHEGCMKIIGFMQHGFRFPTIEEEVGGFGAGWDLHMKALVNLEAYYPSAHPKWEDDPGLTSYIQVLRQHLGDERYNGYALARLLQLNVIKTQDTAVRDSIRQDKHVLEELIELTLTPLRLPQIEADLRYIYTHCFIIGYEAKEVFVEVLREHEAEVENDRMQLRVKLPEMPKTIELTIPEDVFDEVLEEAGQIGYERAMEMKDEPGEPGAGVEEG